MTNWICNNSSGFINVNVTLVSPWSLENCNGYFSSLLLTFYTKWFHRAIISRIIYNENNLSVHPPEGHTKDDSPRLVTNNKTILVEVQQLSLQQLGFTEGRWVVAPGNHSSQHQHTAQHAGHHQRSALMSQLLLQGRTTSSSGRLLLSRSHRDNLIHAEDFRQWGVQGSRFGGGVLGVDGCSSVAVSVGESVWNVSSSHLQQWRKESRMSTCRSSAKSPFQMAGWFVQTCETDRGRQINNQLWCSV